MYFGLSVIFLEKIVFCAKIYQMGIVFLADICLARLRKIWIEKWKFIDPKLVPTLASEFEIYDKDNT